MNKQVRTRIAPSPTGNLHVGTARAALFNEIFARQYGGKFLVRIEDTDKARSHKKFEKNILEGLEWLGLAWDEEIIRQSERNELHMQAIQKLIDKEKAYIDGGAVKLKVELDEIVFDDEIRGEVKIKPEAWGGDFVIARSVTDPVFHLAVVVDDADMGISHVIRGEDHISNTGRHVLLQRALGLDSPVYAHLPLLLDKNKKKLSKRSGETSLLAYRDQGYLQEAMLNFLALLGWHATGDREWFTHEELIEEFKLSEVQKGGAVFDEEKLRAFNQHYIRQLPPAELLERTQPWFETAGLAADDQEYWEQAVELEQERASVLSEIPINLKYMDQEWTGEYQAEMLVWKKSDSKTTKQLLEKLQMELTKWENWDREKLEGGLLSWIDEHELGRGDVLWPMRVALSGEKNSPGPFEIAAILGQTETLKRIKFAINKL